MKRAFIELTFIRPSIAYEYAFVYIRQFAIHLRNAMIAKRKVLFFELITIEFNFSGIGPNHIQLAIHKGSSSLD